MRDLEKEEHDPSKTNLGISSTASSSKFSSDKSEPELGTAASTEGEDYVFDFEEIDRFLESQSKLVPDVPATEPLSDSGLISVCSVIVA